MTFLVLPVGNWTYVAASSLWVFCGIVWRFHCLLVHVLWTLCNLPYVFSRRLYVLFSIHRLELWCCISLLINKSNYMKKKNKKQKNQCNLCIFWSSRKEEFTYLTTHPNEIYKSKQRLMLTNWKLVLFTPS